MVILYWSFRAALLAFLLFNGLLLKVFNHTILDTPPQKVQLGARGREPLELHTLRPTKWIEQLLGVAIQTRLVCHMDRKHLATGRRVRHVVVLGIVGHEPLQFSK